MRAVTHRGSSLPSCRTGPGPHGTWRAMLESSPATIVDVFTREARHAMDLKRLEL